ncbi:diguanylate cyclase [Pleionea sp. CnH1-48]|uniref:diguanylate cyclase n=1 Tax=Pleionea sp. CnH1-48 TaxID=2954494 RepID=UPI002096D445|nr:diguanylate cyclase [Pleionea sp. CnH1-48]MCO7226332.1 diguanylate cyclase [Pleionea sp. CnH1-48]
MRQAKLILLLSILFTLMTFVSLFAIHKFSLRTIEQIAENNAKVLADTLNTSRVLYSKNVIQKVNRTDALSVGADHKNLSDRVPNPATFAIEIGDEITSKYDTTIVRMFSNYPFANRQLTGGPKDQFEASAIQYLTANPTDNFSDWDHIDGMKVYRFAQAIIMEESCVDCHNSHPDSPKKDWQVGDVRGVLDISFPLSVKGSQVQDMAEKAYIIFSLLSLVSFALLILTIVKIRSIPLTIEKELESRTRTLKKESRMDFLTKIPNRRAFDEFLNIAWIDESHQDKVLSLIILDIDNFKGVNDNHGHDIGDECLVEVARILKQSIRSSEDYIARYGGEEFAIVLSHLGKQGALDMAERLRVAIEQHTFSNINLSLTVSQGVASCESFGEICDIKEFIKKADEALYSAKQSGKNKVVYMMES